MDPKVDYHVPEIHNDMYNDDTKPDIWLNSFCGGGSILTTAFNKID